jgi:hypothetical protein
MIDFEEIVFPVTEIRQIKPHEYRGFNFAKLITIYNAEYTLRMTAEKAIERLNKKLK